MFCFLICTHVYICTDIFVSCVYLRRLMRMRCTYRYRRMAHTHQQPSNACAHGQGRIRVLRMTLAGLEPAIFGSEDQRLIH